MKKELIKQLPKLEDLVNDVEVFNENQQLRTFLSQEPPAAWLLPHPTLKIKKNGSYVPLMYLSIERVEFLLNSIMIEWNVEVKSTTLIANSVVTVVRLHHTLPNGVKTYHDGVGASALQIDSGAGSIEFNKMKSAAVQMAAPSSKSYAIKDAAHHIGKIFGKDVNRENFAQSTVAIVEDEPDNAFDKSLVDELPNAQTITDYSHIEHAISEVTDSIDLGILYALLEDEIKKSNFAKFLYLSKAVGFCTNQTELKSLYNKHIQMYNSIVDFDIKLVFSKRKSELSLQ